jgi:kynureninase
VARYRGPGPSRFAGATYDYTSHYRAAAVFKFFEGLALTPEQLRELSQHQVARIVAGLGIQPEVPLDAIAGFLAIRTAHAPQIQAALRQQDIWTDYRGDKLRLGPAPYVTDDQIDEAVVATAVNRAVLQ